MQEPNSRARPLCQLGNSASDMLSAFQSCDDLGPTHAVLSRHRAADARLCEYNRAGGKEVHVGAPSVVGCDVESWTAKAAFSFLACPALRARQGKARHGKARQLRQAIQLFGRHREPSTTSTKLKEVPTARSFPGSFLHITPSPYTLHHDSALQWRRAAPGKGSCFPPTKPNLPDGFCSCISPHFPPT